MRRKLASVIVVIGLLVTSMAPASAVFGLSKCEKVKKQVLAWQKIEKPMIQDWGNYSGNYFYKWESADALKIQKRFINIVNLEVKMYALEMNNPKCFTNTQNTYIKDAYKNWKSYQQKNKFYPNDNNGTDSSGVYISIKWDSIYNQ